MSDDKSVTFLILSHNRPHKLRRLFEYITVCDAWDKYNFIVLDATKKEIQSNIIDLVNEYSKSKLKCFDESINVYDKIKLSLKYIYTPYVMLAADDDFVIFEEIPYLIDNLKHGYTSTIGMTISFQLLKGEHFTYWYCNRFYDIEDLKSFERINKLQNKYFPLLYALIKKDAFCNAIERTCLFEESNLKREIKFSETVIIEGIFKLDSFVSHVREIDSNSDSNLLVTRNKDGFFTPLSYFLRQHKFPIEYFIYPTLQYNEKQFKMIKQLVKNNG